VAILEGAAEQAKAELEKQLASAHRHVAELGDALQSAQVPTQSS
jgi:hypothetical protein